MKIKKRKKTAKGGSKQRHSMLHKYHDELEWDALRQHVERLNALGRVLYVEDVAVDIDQIVDRHFVCDARRCINWKNDPEATYAPGGPRLAGIDTIPIQDQSCCSRFSVPITREGEQRVFRNIGAIVDELPEDHPLKEGDSVEWEAVFQYDEDDNQRSLRMTGALGACLFNFYEDGRGYCAIHRAALKVGASPASWKPVTCLLWPLAVDRFKRDDDSYAWYLTVYCKENADLFEQDQDRPAPACMDDDSKEYPPVYESMRDELEHLFGRDWYRKLLRDIDRLLVTHLEEEAHEEKR